MNLLAPCGEDVAHLPAARGERVGDERAVAAPRHRLRAHDRSFLLGREAFQLRDPSAKLLRLHVVGVAAKTQVAPAEIDRFLRGFAQTTQILEMAVFDFLTRERAREKIEY